MEPTTIMIDVSRRTPCDRVSLRKYLKAHRTASSLRVKMGGRGRLIGRTKGALNTKLHAITDTSGRPIRFFMPAGPVSDYTGAAALLSSLPKAEWLLGDRRYDADWFREVLKDQGSRSVHIPERNNAAKPNANKRSQRGLSCPCRDCFACVSQHQLPSCFGYES